MESKPIQSVIISTYNRKDMLNEAIISVLNQTQKSFEIIVVDDCSTDGTEEYVRGINDERVRYFRNEKNSGSEISRGFGLSQARGKYITFLDDDDYYTDYEFFARAVKIFEENEKAGTPLALVCGDGLISRTYNGETAKHYAGKPGRINGVEFIVKQGGEYDKPTSLFPAVFSAEALRNSGFENKRMFDSETWFIGALCGDLWLMPEIVGVYRLHLESNSFGRKNSPEWHKKKLVNMTERIRLDMKIKARLYELSDKKSVDGWFHLMVTLHLAFFTFRNTGFSDRLKIYYIALKESKFMPSLVMRMPFLALKMELRRFTSLRDFYRKLRGRNSGLY